MCEAWIDDVSNPSVTRRSKNKMELVMIRESGNEQLVNRGRKDTGQVRRESIECTVIRRSHESKESSV